MKAKATNGNGLIFSLSDQALFLRLSCTVGNMVLRIFVNRLHPRDVL